MQVVKSQILSLKEGSSALPTKEKSKKGTSNPKSLKNTIEFFQDKRILNSLFGTNEKVNYFIEHAFQRHPLVSDNNNIEPILTMFNDLDILTLLKETSSDSIHVWLKQLQSETLESITIDDPEQAYKLYQAGHSLYCRAPKEVEQTLVSRLSNELHYGLKNIFNNDRYRRGEIEMFFSRKGHLTKFHTDFQENFTIQLKGSKKWRFKTSSAFAPLRGCTLHFNDANKHKPLIEQQLKVLRLGDIRFSGRQIISSGTDAKEDEQPKKKQKTSNNNTTSTDSNQTDDSQYSTVILHEGDIMYHPAGIWHEVECIEDSISMNISLTAVSYADIFCNHLQQLLLEQPLWRSAIFRPTNDIHFYPTAREVMSSMLTSVPRLLQGILPEDMLPYPTIHTQPEISRDSNTNDRTSKKRESDEDEGEEDEEEEMSFEEVEEGDEEGVVDRDEIHLLAIDVESFLRENIPSITNKSSLSHNQLVDYFSRLSFRVNPFATLLSQDDIYQTSGAILSNDMDSSESTQKKWIVHAGYGNETLESICRKVLIFNTNEKDDEEEEENDSGVSDRLLLAISEIEKKYYQFREFRQSVLNRSRLVGSGDTNEIATIHTQIPIIQLSDFHSLAKKYLKQPAKKLLFEHRLMQLLVGFYFAGLFSSFTPKNE